MKSRMIEFLRFGGGKGVLIKDNPYLATDGTSKARQFLMPLEHIECLRLLSQLRQLSNGKAADNALQMLGDAVTGILQPPKPGPELLQLDLVTNAAEIWALPFEAAKGPNGQALFAGPGSKIVLTRRIRQEHFAEHAPAWPARPRILLVTAMPNWIGGAPDVPLNEHIRALERSLSAWIEPLKVKGYAEAAPDTSSVLRVLKMASLKEIRTACSEARAEMRPFTHIHVLAHGVEIRETGHAYLDHYGLALESIDGGPTEAADLAKALGADASLPVAVTLCVCDSGNAQNSIAPGNLALELHQAGIPIVVASQLPMTFAGSVILTEKFYSGLLAGDDVRDVLHRTRLALYKNRTTAGNDWVGMVAYVQLPEGYADHLLEVRLRVAMESLKTAQRWSDYLLEKKLHAQIAVDHVTKILESRIAQLETYLPAYQNRADCEHVYLENLGLLGSASKRLAELLFRHRRGCLSPMRAAHRWYLKAHQQNLAHHWSGVQHLALEAVLTGKIERPEYWHAACLAARLGADNSATGNTEQRGWACGSLAELLLLAPCVGSKSGLNEADGALRQLKKLAVGAHPFVIESTLNQLRRYTQWWTRKNNYFGARNDLSRDAARLIRLLERDNS